MAGSVAVAEGIGRMTIWIVEAGDWDYIGIYSIHEKRETAVAVAEERVEYERASLAEIFAAEPESIGDNVFKREDRENGGVAWTRRTHYALVRVRPWEMQP